VKVTIVGRRPVWAGCVVLCVLCVYVCWRPGGVWWHYCEEEEEKDCVPYCVYYYYSQRRGRRSLLPDYWHCSLLAIIMALALWRREFWRIWRSWREEKNYVALTIIDCSTLFYLYSSYNSMRGRTAVWRPEENYLWLTLEERQLLKNTLNLLVFPLLTLLWLLCEELLTVLLWRERRRDWTLVNGYRGGHLLTAITIEEALPNNGLILANN